MSVILNMWGEDHTLQFVKQNYFNGNLAIEVLSEESGCWEPWCSLTVNLPGFIHDENEAFLDTNNCSKEIIDWIFKNKYVKKIGERKSGYCTYPLVEFSKEFMEMVFTSPVSDEDDYDESDEWNDDSDIGCADCPDDECHGHCMSCAYRPV